MIIMSVVIVSDSDPGFFGRFGSFHIQVVGSGFIYINPGWDPDLANLNPHIVELHHR